jgi:hypothetical protein
MQVGAVYSRAVLVQLSVWCEFGRLLTANV